MGGYSTTTSTILRALHVTNDPGNIALERSVSSLGDFAIRMADCGVKELVWVDESFKEERTCMKSY